MKHLGGHANMTHLDLGAIMMAKEMGFETMLDIGCGPGGMVKLALDNGIQAEGVDGMPGHKREPVKITIQDFSKGEFVSEKEFDFAWSCEFVEHVEERYVPNFMKAFQKCKYVFMTFAPPNTPGHHHVNCNTEEYWINMFEKYNFEYIPSETAKLRISSTMKRDFVRKCGLVFRRKS